MVNSHKKVGGLEISALYAVFAAVALIPHIADILHTVALACAMAEKYQGFFHSEFGGITDKTTVFPFAVLTGDYHFPVGIAESVDTDITARSKAKQTFLIQLCTGNYGSKDF